MPMVERRRSEYKILPWGALARLRGNMIISLQDGSSLFDKKEDIINHITSFFRSLYTKEEWVRPSLDYFAFDSIGVE